MFDATDFFGNETFIGKRNSVSYDILIDRDDNHGNLDITAWRDEGRRRISVGNYFVHPDKTLEQEVGKFLDLSLLPQGVDVYFDSVEIHHECDRGQGVASYMIKRGSELMVDLKWGLVIARFSPLGLIFKERLLRKGFRPLPIKEEYKIPKKHKPYTDWMFYDFS